MRATPGHWTSQPHTTGPFKGPLQGGRERPLRHWSAHAAAGAGGRGLGNPTSLPFLVPAARFGGSLGRLARFGGGSCLCAASDASAMQRYRWSHGGRTHVEHHELLAAMYVAFFEAALDAMPALAALSINLTSERRTPDVCHSRDALSGVAWQHPGCAPAAAPAAPAASAAPATSGRTGRISSDGYDGYDSCASRVSSTGSIRPHQAISGHIRPHQAASGRIRQAAPAAPAALAAPATAAAPAA